MSGRGGYGQPPYRGNAALFEEENVGFVTAQHFLTSSPRSHGENQFHTSSYVHRIFVKLDAILCQVKSEKDSLAMCHCGTDVRHGTRKAEDCIFLIVQILTEMFHLDSGTPCELFTQD